MSWLYILGLVVAVIVLVALLRVEPPEGRPVSRTHLMTAARVVLAVTIVVFLVLALR